MSSTFGGQRFVLPSPFTSTILPAPASTQISVGDLLYWTGSYAQPLSAATGGASAIVDQKTMADAFVGVAKQARIVQQTTAGGYNVFPAAGIAIETDCIYEADCSSATFEVGTLVGVVSSASGAAGAVSDQSVVAVTNPCLAIGYVMQKYASATTKVRVRLLGKNQSAYANPYLRTMGSAQAVGPEAPAATGTTTLTLASTAVQRCVPTAAKDIVLPATASSKGLWFFICNDSAGAYTLTVKDAAATTIVSVAQNKRAMCFCDGSYWYGILTA